MFLFKNLSLKIFAIFGAILFWIFVVMSTSQLKTFPTEDGLPVGLFNLSENLMVSGELPTVRVKLNTNQKTFDTLSNKSFSIFVDLAGRSAGTYTLPLSVTSENPEILVQRIDPEEITITLEEVAEKELPINVEIEGQPSSNFTLGEPVLEENRMKVRGPKSEIDSASEVVATITLTGKEEDGVLEAWPIVVRDAQHKVLTNIVPEKAKLAITLPLTQVAIGKTVGVKVALTGVEQNSDYSVSKITSDPLFVEVRGDAKILRDLDAISTQEVDVSSLDRNTTRTVGWALPEGVSLADTEPEIVIVSLELTRRDTLRQVGCVLSAESQPEDIIFDPSEISVTVSGQPEALRTLARSGCTVDLGPLSDGTKTLRISLEKISIPAGLEVLDFSPREINLISK